MCVLTVAVVGCGHEDGDGARASHPERQAAAPTKVLGHRELERTALESGDVDGFSVGPMVGDAGAGQPVVSQVPPAPSRCKPLNDMTGFVGRYQPVWQVAKTVGRTSDESDMSSTTVALNSYRQQDSVKVVTELRGALDTCTKFTPPGSSTTGWTYSHIRKLPDPSLGDDALSYRITLDMPADDAGPAHSVVFSYVVVRSGTTVTTFASNLFGVNDEPTEVPRQLIDAQLKKLSQASSG
ncbi:hypothetical protein OIE69_42595 [Actinacidiphila glaucinigra]|uniref:hypothetical protein n=1 Tax=Actinacidiphila glaucinigra TaxID=235986 RepID=UPI002DDB119C|nr:hypothetical protein [Actinacidiphila glaucinigra]WSD65088.1 hypothetical protein OIE69_42595 [Actinacidiphila glaucinigra]